MSVSPPVVARRFRWRASTGRRAQPWGWLDRVCLAVIALFAVLAVFGPLLAPQDPDALNIRTPNAGPSADHWLGTDQVGRDLLSRLLDAAPASLLGPLVVALMAAVLGSLLGMVAAWRGGWTDQAVSAVSNVAFAFPGLLLAILSTAVFGRGLAAPIIALGIAYTPYVLRVSRAAMLRERRLPYVQALTVQGFSAWAICARHIFPAILPLIVAQTTLGFGYATVDLAAISYLGLGVQPPDADWGTLVANGQSLLLEGKPAMSLYAGGLIVIAVMAVTIFGERFAARAEARR